MENVIEKSFINQQIGIKFNSYIDEKFRVWFKAKDVAKILGYRDTDKAIRMHVDKEDKYKGPAKTAGGLQNCVFINESGFYSLVLSSKLETAKNFKRWVISKVLPSIRKYGFYKKVDLKIKQRVIFKGKKYYKHPVFNSYAARKNGDILSLKTERILNMANHGEGYLCFGLYDEKLEKKLGKKRINYLQHRFVYEVFRGPIPKCFEVDHINGIKSDNRIKNLQLLTPKQNIEKSKNKAIISTCIEDGKERRFISIKKAANELDINSAHISDICRKKKYCKSATSKKDGKKYTFKFLD